MKSINTLKKKLSTKTYNASGIITAVAFIATIIMAGSYFYTVSVIRDSLI